MSIPIVVEPVHGALYRARRVVFGVCGGAEEGSVGEAEENEGDGWKGARELG